MDTGVHAFENPTSIRRRSRPHRFLSINNNVSLLIPPPSLSYAIRLIRRGGGVSFRHGCTWIGSASFDADTASRRAEYGVWTRAFHLLRRIKHGRATSAIGRRKCIPAPIRRPAHIFTPRSFPKISKLRYAWGMKNISVSYLSRYCRNLEKSEAMSSPIAADKSKGIRKYIKSGCPISSSILRQYSERLRDSTAFGSEAQA